MTSNRVQRRRSYIKTESALTDPTSSLYTTVEASVRMSRIRQSGTFTELCVRRLLRRHGFVYRLRNRDLPGSPDLANRRAKWAIFVNGCYWHHHTRCALATTPKSNTAFWKAKFARNRARDARVARALRNQGFAVAIVWQCELGDEIALWSRIKRRLQKKKENE